MDVILLEKIAKLGELGAVVTVRPGFGRNYLIPSGKALPATAANRARFDAERAALEAKQQAIRAQAEELAAKIAEISVVLDRPAGSNEKLFGSVTNADIADYFKAKGVDVPRKAIVIAQPLRTLGTHAVQLRLHPDVSPEIKVRIDRSVK
ncbi:MAG: 50S ribosomal protein L9 [Magnetococcales bacterium]|nr:50S ribosomal protein L9 [Magnetococcales bacterium]NGZ26936.1 50S ribosomal protein L9 [Magnetococcales bacterium]